jgi:anthranilate synthase/aminodeoxychorismate synthase-like glutamine amidotransferase
VKKKNKKKLERKKISNIYIGEKMNKENTCKIRKKENKTGKMQTKTHTINHKQEKKIKIIYVDNYDSFANTIEAYFINAGAEVVMYNSNCSIKTIEKEKPNIILLGPGPNGPKEAGNYLKVIEHFHKRTPIFGICLGFQAIMEYFGEPVKPLKEVMHGQASEIQHDGKTIFEGITPKQKFARYHSLGVLKVPQSFEISAKAGEVVMAARHKTLPIEGVQFHPESILSMENEGGKKLIANVLKYLARKNIQGS